MATITIRNLDEQTQERPRVRAAHGSRSMEEEAIRILRAALAREPEPGPDLAAAIRARFEALGGVELELPPRNSMREPPVLEASRRSKRRGAP